MSPPPLLVSPPPLLVSPPLLLLLVTLVSAFLSLLLMRSMLLLLVVGGRLQVLFALVSVLAHVLLRLMLEAPMVGWWSRVRVVDVVVDVAVGVRVVGVVANVVIERCYMLVPSGQLTTQPGVAQHRRRCHHQQSS